MVAPISNNTGIVGPSTGWGTRGHWQVDLLSGLSSSETSLASDFIGRQLANFVDRHQTYDFVRLGDMIDAILPASRKDSCTRFAELESTLLRILSKLPVAVPWYKYRGGKKGTAPPELTADCKAYQHFSVGGVVCTRETFVASCLYDGRLPTPTGVVLTRRKAALKPKVATESFTPVLVQPQGCELVVRMNAKAPPGNAKQSWLQRVLAVFTNYTLDNAGECGWAVRACHEPFKNCTNPE